MNLAEELTEMLASEKIMPGSHVEAFQNRVPLGQLTRAENPSDHFGTFMFPYDSTSKKLFLIHHRKSGKWIPPGEHIELGELSWQAIERGIQEELGTNFIMSAGRTQQILLTTIEINNPGYACRKHYDLWYFIDFHQTVEFKIEQREFYTGGWFDIGLARSLIKTDAVMVHALETANQNLFQF